MCLAHLLRDTQFAIDCGDEGFSRAFKRLLGTSKNPASPTRLR
jgi:hypothetical protein